MTQATLQYRLVQTEGMCFEVSQHGEGERLALLLHGFPECAYSYRYQIPRLVELGYRVWVPNLRGYGNSDKPRGRRAYALDRLEQDVTALIDASGARSVLLAGHDWGGAIAWSYGSFGPRPLTGLVILNSPHPACFQRHLRSPAQLRRSWYMFLNLLPLLPERLLSANRHAYLLAALRSWPVHKENFGPEELDVYRANATKPGALTAMLNYYRAMPYDIWLHRRRGVGRVRAPTLIIWGEQDRALGRELLDGTERFVDDLTIRTIPDASHWVQQDAPDKVNALLERWLHERGLVGTDVRAASA
ncbi:MAG TPA: alpha/beta hydrolase [Polyangiales bacterium]